MVIAYATRGLLSHKMSKSTQNVNFDTKCRNTDTKYRKSTQSVATPTQNVAKSKKCLEYMLPYRTKFRRTKISTDKMFRRTKISTPSRNFVTYVRRNILSDEFLSGILNQLIFLSL